MTANAPFGLQTRAVAFCNGRVIVTGARLRSQTWRRGCPRSRTSHLFRREKSERRRSSCLAVGRAGLLRRGRRNRRFQLRRLCWGGPCGN
eukprot:9826851-Lingulodinium_polyedra.AAC.1